MYKNILIIDDDKGLLKLLSTSLTTNGFKISTAENGEAGLEAAKRDRPDLIILDVLMPGIKGREVCARLKSEEATKDIPVIFLTSKKSQDDIKAEMELGALTHFTKPVDSKKLLKELKKILS